MHEQIAELCKEGDALASAGRLDEAKNKYIAALKLLPGEPQRWEAADELTRAYMGGGIDIFMEDDPKYLEFLETRISL